MVFTSVGDEALVASSGEALVFTEGWPALMGEVLSVAIADSATSTGRTTSATGWETSIGTAALTVGWSISMGDAVVDIVRRAKSKLASRMEEAPVSLIPRQTGPSQTLSNHCPHATGTCATRALCDVASYRAMRTHIRVPEQTWYICDNEISISHAS